ncbi:hypothetical protein VTN77DRAFT_6439 [Rasamsonia byssochlamydoides]|uniref:uncharacterized protein n=1 Tax=Rasamsonia byssochlamydoides TaxID=89139 RepID=UPI0037438C40
MFRDSRGLDAILNRKRPTAWQLFMSNPIIFLAQKIWSSRAHNIWTRTAIRDESAPPTITFVCISDTHNGQPDVPDGDVLIHAGDLTQSGSGQELQATIDWLNTLPHRHKIVIAGNHDLVLDSAFVHVNKDEARRRDTIQWGNVVYLQDHSVTLDVNGRSIKVFGSPWTPRHGNWAFQYPRTEDIWRERMPSDVDVLITHGPPRGHLDLNSGCLSLLRELWRLDKKPRLHVFGHIHEGHGQEWVEFDGLQAAYEYTVKSNGGVFRLARVLYEYLRTCLRSQQSSSSTTILVNAALAGGLRDKINKKAVVVHI